MEEILKELVEQLKNINESLELHNDIILSHHISTGEIEMDEVSDLNYVDLDS